MDLFELSQLFGGSLFADDYRGDFEQISASIERHETNSGYGHSHDHRLLLKKLLQKAVFWTLSGNHAKARQWLQSLRHHYDSIDRQWESRIKCYELLNLVDRLHPPAIRFRSQLGSSAAIIFEAQNQLLVDEILSSSSEHGSLEQLELSMPLRIYQYNHFLWTMQCQHPKYARPEFALGSSDMLSRIGSPFPVGYVESAMRMNLAGIAGSLKRLSYEAEVARFPEIQNDLLTMVMGFSEQKQDLVGEALCLISKADKLISPPFTSPLSLNFIVEGKLTGMVDGVWDFEEPKFALRANAEAESHYQNALHLMEAAGSPRGCAAVLLRQATVLHMEALFQSQSRKSHATQQLSEASSKLEGALLGFRGDEANLCLVNCHQILLEISQHNLNADDSAFSVETRAAEIGLWGKSAENTALSQFCALLMLRFGRRMFLDHSHLDVALLCVSCAKSVLKSSDDKQFYLQAILSEADLVHSSGNFAQAELILREACKPSLDVVLQYLKELGQASSTAQTSLKGPTANLLLFYDRIASKILMSAADASALQLWRDEYSKLEFEVGADRFFEMPQISSFRDTVHASGSTASSPLDFAAILQEQNENRRLGELYSTKSNAAYAELEIGNIDGYDGQLASFLASVDSVRASKDQIATFKVIANSSLGFFSEATRYFPLAVPRLFGLEETSAIETLRRVSYLGVTVDNSLQMDRNQAERGISLSFLCHDWTSGLRLLHNANQSVPGYLNINDDTARGHDWKLDSWIGAIYEHNNHYDEALRWYLRALHVMETYRSRNADAAARSGSQSSIHGAELFSGLVRVSLSKGARSLHSRPNSWGLPTNSWYDQALMFTEQSSARTLLEFLMSQPELVYQSENGAEKLEQWAEYTYVNRQITDLSTIPGQQESEAVKTELASLRKQLNKIKDNQAVARQLPKTTQALLQASRFNISMKSLLAAIPHKAAVIEINMSRSGIVVFCVTRTGIQRVHQSGTTIIQMRRLILKYLEEISKYQKMIAKPSSRLATSTALPMPDSVEDLNYKSARISDEIIAPFTNIIAEKEHVIFVPSGEFNVFPLSALMYEGQPLFVSRAVSQVPSFATLAQLTSRALPKTPLVVSTIFNTHERKKVGPIPKAPERSPNALKPMLNAPVPTPMVGVSALLTSQLFGSYPIYAPDLTEEDFHSTYNKSDIVVLSTHGIRSQYSPWQSYIKLARDFRVMELVKFRTHAALVIFGACLSGMGRVTAGNDIHGFSHAVLQSGAQTYMGALWSVSDYTTMLLLLAFFRKVADAKSNISLADCWQHAQKVLYSLDSTTALDMLKQIENELDRLKADGVSTAPLGNDENGKRQLLRMIKDMQDGVLKTNFKHPYYWAPFGLVGNGGLCLYGENYSELRAAAGSAT